VYGHLHWAHRGVRGGKSPPRGGSGAAPLKFLFSHQDRIFGTTLYLGGFSAHGFFSDGFLFSVKELGFWTNLGHWVRVLDATGSYMYFVL
jgi:hypothetical protein